MTTMTLADQRWDMRPYVKLSVGLEELFDELMASLQLNVVSFFNSPMPAQPLGWFKKQIKSVDDIKGLKYRTVGLAADVMLEMGMSVQITYGTMMLQVFLIMK